MRVQINMPERKKDVKVTTCLLIKKAPKIFIFKYEDRGLKIINCIGLLNQLNATPWYRSLYSNKELLFKLWNISLIAAVLISQFEYS